jgi:hypothetical protein
MFDNASLEEFSMTTAVNAIGDVTHGSLENVVDVQSPCRCRAACFHPSHQIH